MVFCYHSLVDVFRHESVVTSLEFSPNGESLVASLKDDVGLFLWTNKTMFESVSLKPIPSDYVPPILTSSSSFGKSFQSLFFN